MTPTSCFRFIFSFTPHRILGDIFSILPLLVRKWRLREVQRLVQSTPQWLTESGFELRQYIGFLNSVLSPSTFWRLASWKSIWEWISPFQLIWLWFLIVLIESIGPLWVWLIRLCLGFQGLTKTRVLTHKARDQVMDTVNSPGWGGTHGWKTVCQAFPGQYVCFCISGYGWKRISVFFCFLFFWNEKCSLFNFYNKSMAYLMSTIWNRTELHKDKSRNPPFTLLYPQLSHSTADKLTSLGIWPSSPLINRCTQHDIIFKK